ncbi:hypothetical protein ACIQ6Y_22410 [Streptomyces sp. NPDC096205]|uniref:hypothetical protein n=1 Tax=Streptomyces sp. NPDC096205 TaxID=3366081 RepID=UPI0037F13916
MPRRRRGRTAALITGAVVLGLVAGTCAGYLVQADREPTKLPPLSQPVLAQAKGPGPEPLSAAQDRQVRTEGDLRKLLLPKPKGAKEADWSGIDGWMDLTEYADTYEEPADAFGSLTASEFRRAAVTAWEVGHTAVEIRLIQFHQKELAQAAEHTEDSQYWAEKEEDTDRYAIPGTGEGWVYVHNRAHSEPGYLPQYSARALAYRGDIALELWVTDTKAIGKKTVMDLAKRQMERL